MRYLIFIAALIATPTWAQMTPRDTDTVLTKDALVALVSGKMVEFYSGGFARHGADGSYDYRYALNGPPAPGTYEVQDGGVICMTFHNGFDRCDMIVQAGARYVMIIENGERYPIKAITELE